MNSLLNEMSKLIKVYATYVLSIPICDHFFHLLGGTRLHAKLYVRSSKKRLLVKACKEFAKESYLGDLNDYKKALAKHWVSYNEYAYQYEFYKKSEKEREEYISQLRMAYFYLRYASGEGRWLFRNKQVFLKVLKNYIHRLWLYIPETSYEDFEKLVTNYDCIVKPYDGSRGKGVYKIYKDADHKEDRKLYEQLKKDRVIVEQCIEACEELKVFHPQSLNTIRVITFSNKVKACVFSGVLRTGIGDSVIDNSHAGGVSAQINIEKGVVESDGVDNKGNRYVYHPDSNIQFEGYKIPQWDIIVKTCCEVANQFDNPITGWDVVVDKNGQVEFIEGNHTPDLDMMQSRYNIGLKNQIRILIQEYCGIEMK